MGFEKFECTPVKPQCAQKIAEARLPIEAIANELKVRFDVDDKGNVKLNGKKVTFFLQVDHDPVFRASAMENKIVNIGYVWATLIVKAKDMSLKHNCIRVSLVFQEEEIVCGVQPGDIIEEQVLSREGTATAVVLESVGRMVSSFSGGPGVLKAVVEPTLVMKASFIVQKVVQREVKVPIDVDCPEVPCPICPDC